MVRQNLDRNSTIQSCIARAVDFTHPARTERRDDLIRPELGPGNESHRCVPL